MRSIVCASLALIALGTSRAQSCASLSPTAFELPSVFTITQTDPNKNWVNMDQGLNLVDVNGDSLIDVVQGYTYDLTNPGSTFICIYLNTGCGWVLQADYKGPVNTCIPSELLLRNVSMSFAGLTVKAFTAEVAEYFELRRSDVEVRVGGPQGVLQGPTHRMDVIASKGFHVVLSKTEVYAFDARTPAPST